jgi:hypothetical protein
MRADLGVADERGTGSVKRCSHRCRQVERREATRIKRHDPGAEALCDGLEVGRREPVPVRRNARPEGCRHIAGT